MNKLFTPHNLVDIQLKNRVVMAPMTRTRTLNGVADELTALYYSQRASAGLIITEGLPVSEEGRGYLYTPGLYNDEQMQGWKSYCSSACKRWSYFCSALACGKNVACFSFT